MLLLCEMIQHWLNLHISFPGSEYVLLALSSVVFFYGGWPFLKGLVAEVRAKSPGMMFLIGFAITVAYIYSVAIVFGLHGMDFFWEPGDTYSHYVAGALDRNEVSCWCIKRIRIIGAVNALRGAYGNAGYGT